MLENSKAMLSKDDPQLYYPALEPPHTSPESAKCRGGAGNGLASAHHQPL